MRKVHVVLLNFNTLLRFAVFLSFVYLVKCKEKGFHRISLTIGKVHEDPC